MNAAWEPRSALREAPRTSIVIPTYNRRPLVQRAIESVLRQRGSEAFEVIVVDDGSRDGTPAVLRARYADEPRVRVLQSAHRGPSAARNLGFAASRGDIVCFLDSDDRLLPRALRRIDDLFARHPELAFASLEGFSQGVRARIVRSNPGWTVAHTAGPPGGVSDEADAHLLRADLFPAVLDGDLFYLSGLFIRRTAVQSSGPFNERYRLLEDWDFHARLCLRGAGALLDRIGFVRGASSADQLSRRLSPLRQAAMRLRIVDNAARSGFARRRADRVQLERAACDARYWLGRLLAASRHPRVGRRLLLASLKRGYKPARSLVLLGMSALRSGLRRLARAFDPAAARRPPRIAGNAT